MLSKLGIPQGTRLGPILVLVVINDLPQPLTNKCSIFADDTTAYTLERDALINCQNLSSDLLAASEWAAQWGMTFGAKKSEHLSISNKSTCASSTRLYMGQACLPQVTSHKHLGVHVKNNLSWSLHIDHVYTSCARKIGIMKRLRR